MFFFLVIVKIYWYNQDKNTSLYNAFSKGLLIVLLMWFTVGLRDFQIVWPVGFMPLCSLTVQQSGGARPAPFMQSRQSRGRPGNTKCLINLLICCDCRAWKACFLAIWGQENPLLCCLQTHKYHTYTQLFLPTVWPTFMCGGGNKDRITLDYLHEGTTMGTSILMAPDSTKLTWRESMDCGFQSHQPEEKKRWVKLQQGTISSLCICLS